MPSSHQCSSPAEGAGGDEGARLSEEVVQLRQAVRSHAVIDQAIGVLIAVWQVPPADGWEVLREVSQHCNLRLHAVADEVVGCALGGPISPGVREELVAAVDRWRVCRAGPSGQAHEGGTSPTAGATGHVGDRGPGE